MTTLFFWLVLNLGVLWYCISKKYTYICMTETI